MFGYSLTQVQFSTKLTVNQSEEGEHQGIGEIQQVHRKSFGQSTRCPQMGHIHRLPLIASLPLDS